MAASRRPHQSARVTPARGAGPGGPRPGARRGLRRAGLRPRGAPYASGALRA